MGCTSSKEPVQHGIITYCVCRGCQASPVRDEMRLCGKCEHAKASGRPVRPRQLCPSCQKETVTYTGEICATCKPFLRSSVLREEVPDMAASVGAVKARRPDSAAVARLPGTILSNAPARRGASSQKERGSKKIVIERGYSGGTPPQRQPQRDGSSTEFYIDRGHSGETPPQSKATRSSKYNPDRMSSRLPLRMPNREIPVL